MKLNLLSAVLILSSSSFASAYDYHCINKAMELATAGTDVTLQTETGAVKLSGKKVESIDQAVFDLLDQNGAAAQLTVTTEVIFPKNCGRADCVPQTWLEGALNYKDQQIKFSCDYVN